MVCDGPTAAVKGMAALRNPVMALVTVTIVGAWLTSFTIRVWVSLADPSVLLTVTVTTLEPRVVQVKLTASESEVIFG